MRTPGTAAELERRRRRAVTLLDAGERPCDVMRVLGVSKASLTRWRRAAVRPTGLAAKPHPGRRPALTPTYLAALERLLLRGAAGHGWANDLWTAARVATVIRRHFGVGFHPEHVRKVLKRSLGRSSQRPRLRAAARDEDRIAAWHATALPRLVADAVARAATVAFVDESGFTREPLVRRTLAPRGKTPVVRAKHRRDRITALSAVTAGPGGPGLSFRLLPANRTAKAADVVAVLRQLRAAVPGPLVVVWDGATIHGRSAQVRRPLAAHPAVTAVTPPGDAPDLNPDERVWQHTKYSRMANFAPADAAELRAKVREELWDLKTRPDVLRSFVRHAAPPALAC